MSVQCPSCGAYIDDGTPYCDLCGTKLTAPALPAGPPPGKREAMMTIRCPQCGADNRDSAKFCGVCGERLAQIIPTQPLQPTILSPISQVSSSGASRPPATSPTSPPIPAAGASPLGIPLRAWDPAPQAEGRVVFASDKNREQKGGLVLKTVLAAMLGLIHVVLAWLPFVGGSELNVRDLRVHDVHSGRVIHIKVRGDPTGSIELGDTVAVWGKWDGGNLAMGSAYNYTTNSTIKLKHRR